MRPLFAFLLLLLALALGCGRRDASAPPTERQRQIARLQEFSQEKGMPRTGNFRRADPRRSAYYLCYSTGKWELPEDYNGLRYKESDEHGCRINTVKYDVYFHRVEAVAMVNAPVTQSLEAASDERALMVAAHEEAHEDPQLRRFPAEIAESATTLLGILTAAEFAMRDGDTATATHLSEDARTFSRKAEAVNELHAKLRALYAAHRAGKRGRAATAAEKERLFAGYANACKAFGSAHSINPCLPASNNAGLAFDHTYTRAYPLLYALFEACHSDLDVFLGTLRKIGEQLSAKGPQGRRAKEAERRIREAIDRGVQRRAKSAP
ncbi:MAG: aminopeptidase [Bryobacterales bacterium]|nr:aminopeptidase [Bryobacterales bacterium]